MFVFTNGYYNSDTNQIMCGKHIPDDGEWKRIHSSEVVGPTFHCETCNNCIVCGNFHDIYEDCIWEDKDETSN